MSTAVPLNGMGRPVVGWAAHQRLQAAWSAVQAAQDAATRIRAHDAWVNATRDYHAACAAERAS